jgi:putative endonuclease
MKMNQNNSGLAAETMAATFLTERGLTLIARNYHCRFGEIDLVMKEGNVLIFVEVRLRSHSTFGSAASSINYKKQQKLILAAQHYLQQNGEQACRFDVIAMPKVNEASIEWIRNAFDA